MTRAKRRRRDPETTRRDILKAAEKLFIEQGYGATSLSQIGQCACAHKSLILHHFDSKEGLWQAVKNCCFQAFVEEQKALYRDGEVSVKELEQTVSAYFYLLQRNPKMVQLLSWAELERDLNCSQFDEERLATFHRRLQQAQDRGLLREDINTAHLLLLVINASTQWFEARGMFANWSALEQDEELDQRFLDSLLDIVFHGALAAEARS